MLHLKKKKKLFIVSSKCCLSCSLPALCFLFYFLYQIHPDFYPSSTCRKVFLKNRCRLSKKKKKIKKKKKNCSFIREQFLLNARAFCNLWTRRDEDED